MGKLNYAKQHAEIGAACPCACRDQLATQNGVVTVELNWQMTRPLRKYDSEANPDFFADDIFREPIFLSGGAAA